MYTFINSIEDLKFLNQEFLKKSFLGVDTEFRRTSKNNMKLALLQVNDDEEIFLIDTLAIGNPKESASFLFEESVLKIFHSCKEDIEAVYAWTNQEMVNIFDTQIANAFLDGDFSISYQGLVEKELGINLEKKETRSNWIRRPLSESQLKYAALDVEYLIHLYRLQKEQLYNSSKLSWHNQDVKRLLEMTFIERSPFFELDRSISRAQEAEILGKFNKLVEEISRRKKINPTLFFSKKAQKDFLRLVLSQGIESACKAITMWRSQLIKDKFLNILE